MVGITFFVVADICVVIIVVFISCVMLVGGICVVIIADGINDVMVVVSIHLPSPKWFCDVR